jgi:hypothetical protein
MKPENKTMSISFDFDVKTPAIYPIDVYPPAIRDFIRMGAESLNCPPDFLATTILVVASLAMGSKPRALIKKDWKEPVVIMAAIVGEPTSKKSPAMMLALSPILNIQKRMIQNSVDNAANDRTWFTTDVTFEALFELLERHHHGVGLVRDELAGLWRSMNQYKGKGDDMEKFLSFWNCAMIIIKRKGKPRIQINRPFVPVIGSTQEDLLKELFEMPDNGFAPRFLYCYPLPMPYKWTGVEMDDTVLKEYCQLIESIIDFQEKTEERDVPFSPEAKALWNVWDRTYNTALDQSELHPRMKGALGKLQAYTARFALILEYLHAFQYKQNPTCIGVESLQKAIQLSSYYGSHFARALESVTSAPLERQLNLLLRWFKFRRKKQYHTATTREALTNGAANIKNSQEAISLFLELKSRGFGSVRTVSETDTSKTLQFTLAQQYWPIPEEGEKK